MATKVFISWSGELSRKLGEALRNWLPSTLQYVKPYFTPSDVEKGTKWDSEISHELGTPDFGIFCITSDNTEKPWILFEAGALSKGIDKSRVCTLLFEIEQTEIKPPLANFQATKFIKEDFKKLVATINNVAGDSRIDSPVLEKVFNRCWPELEEEVNTILQTHDKGVKPKKRTERDIIEELLELTRLNASRVSRPDRFSPGTISNIVDCLKMITDIFTNDKKALTILSVLEYSIRQLFLEAGESVKIFDQLLLIDKKQAESNEPKFKRKRAPQDAGLLQAISK
jgi:hypothetical protein